MMRTGWRTNLPMRSRPPRQRSLSNLPNQPNRRLTTPLQPTPSRARTGRSREGAVLLEVVLSLLLFVAAVAVVSSALNSSMESIHRQRSRMHAANLAATIHAEIDMGLRATDRLGPEPFIA